MTRLGSALTMLFIPERHEALIDTPWDETRVRAAIQAIASDVCAQFDPATLWPTHPLESEPGEAHVPRPMLYNGAAGVVWTLDRLRRQGAAEVALDLTPVAASLHAHSLHWMAANRSEPASYFLGQTGVLLVQWMQQPAQATADALYALVEGNLRNQALEALWGSPGTLLAALHLLETTHETRWQVLFRRGIDILWEQMHPVRHAAEPGREVWVWTQDLYGSTRILMGAGHGFAGNLFPVICGARWLDADLVAAFESRALDTLQVSARFEAGLVNWEPVFDPVAAGLPFKPLVQDCHGAPGIVCRLAGTRSVPLQDLLVEAGELIWRAGPLAKRPGLCHGTDGNGLAFLKLHAMTGDSKWLGRARSFAMQALQQSDELAARHGSRVPSLWTGDLGLAFYLWACVRVEADLPMLDTI